MGDDELTPEERDELYALWVKMSGGRELGGSLDSPEIAQALERMREDLAQETDPPLKAHMERRLKLLDPKLRKAYIRTLKPADD